MTLVPFEVGRSYRPVKKSESQWLHLPVGASTIREKAPVLPKAGANYIALLVTSEHAAEFHETGLLTEAFNPFCR